MFYIKMISISILNDFNLIIKNLDIIESVKISFVIPLSKQLPSFNKNILLNKGIISL